MGSRGNIRLRKDTGRYEVNYYDADGTRRWMTFGRKKEAERALRQKLTEVDAIKAGVAPRQVVEHTWEELVQLWENRKSEKRSLADDQSRARLHLTPVLAGTLVTAIRAERLAQVENELKRKVSRGQLARSTANKVLRLLKAMLRLAHKAEWLQRVPHIEIPRDPPIVAKWIRTTNEIRGILVAANSYGYPGLLECYATAIYAGLRVGEICGLEWSDLDFDNGLIRIRRSEDKPYPKNNKYRTVFIADPLVPLLRAWRNRCPSDTLVFPNLANKRQRRDSRVFRSIFHECRERAGLLRLTFHALRHTFASHYMLAGGDIFRLSCLLGHQSVAFTARVYAHLSLEAYDQDRGLMPKMF